MNYFEAISHRCDQLTEVAQKFLDSRTFIDKDVMVDAIIKSCEAMMKKRGLDPWLGDIPSDIPEWAQDFLDFRCRFVHPSANGSIYHALGFSTTARDANLRLLYERAISEDAESMEEPKWFTMLAEKEIVEKLTS